MRIEDCFTESSGRTVVKAGDTVFKEGQHGDLMYVLLRGVVDIFISGQLVGTFEAVEIIGEMAVIDPGPRSATVIAKTDCHFVTLNQKRFLLLTEHKPDFAIHVMKVLVERIRWLNAAAEAPSTKCPSVVEPGANDSAPERFDNPDDELASATQKQEGALVS
ncbi:MAG: cyclic nucleotide-binding domain-containing protein [Verrucomicrobia bacterium]|nr:cyclic nucleotide-binding domain-containing protein [Verrucomicrobiota bacterium]